MEQRKRAGAPGQHQSSLKLVTMKSRVLLVDDHQIVLDGLKRILESSDVCEVVGHLITGQEALRFLEHFPVDILLTDLDMPEMHGSELVKRVKASHPGVKTMVLSMHHDPVLVKELFAIGINGFVVKTASEEEIVMAVKKVLSGAAYYSAEVTTSLMGQEASAPAIHKDFQLTGREQEILQLVADGLSTKEIGEKLFISTRTVDSHRLSLMRKLEVKNIAALLRFAFKNGLID